MSPSRFRFALIALPVLAIAGYWGWWKWTAPYEPQGPVVGALGGSWIADNPTWTELDGMWRLDTVFYPRRVSFSGASGEALLRSFCGNILTRRPDPPETPAFDRHQMYGVTLNVMLPDPDGRGHRAFFDHPVRIPVYNGQCRLDTSWGKLSPRYPNELIHWTIETAEVTDGGEKATFLFKFDPLDDAAEPGEFPFLKACEAVLADPFVRFPNLATGEEHDPDAHEKFKEVKIRVRTSGGNYVVVHFGTFVGYRFRVAGGLCVDGVQVDA